MIHRLAELRKLEKLSQIEFAQAIKISQSALSQIESGKTSMAINTLYSIISTFNINSEWLLFGKGEIYKKKKIPIAHGTPLTSSDKDNSHLIKFITRDAVAGYPEQCHDEEYVNSLDGYRIPGFENGNFRMFQISGDSMIPTLYEDEIVIVEAIDDIECIQANRQCVIVTMEGIIAKRVFPQKMKKLLLKSDNPKYKSFKLDHENVLEVWEVKAKITSEFLSPPLSGQMSDDIDKRIEALENTVNMLSIALKNGSEENNSN